MLNFRDSFGTEFCLVLSKGTQTCTELWTGWNPIQLIIYLSEKSLIKSNLYRFPHTPEKNTYTTRRKYQNKKKLQHITISRYKSYPE